MARGVWSITLSGTWGVSLRVVQASAQHFQQHRVPHRQGDAAQFGAQAGFVNGPYLVEQNTGGFAF